VATTGLLASTVVMGLLTGAIALFVIRGRAWRRYSPDVSALRADSLRDGELGPGTMALGFVLLVFVVGGAAVLLVGGFETLPLPAPGISAAIAIPALLGLLLVGYVVAGSYATARSHGAGNAQAALVGLWAFGLLFVLAVAAQLLTA
jgi:hypothetical protein